MVKIFHQTPILAEIRPCDAIYCSGTCYRKISLGGLVIFEFALF